MGRITAPHLTAGVVYQRLPNGMELVVRAAPILKYMIGWREEKVAAYCRTKNWHYERID